MNLPRGVGEDQLVWDSKPGVWYRTPAYKQSHKQHREDPEMFWCGRTLWPTPGMVDTLPEPEWWVVVDDRKGDKCGKCKELEAQWIDREAWARAMASARGRDPRVTPQDETLVVHPDALPRVAQWLMMED